MNPRALGVIAVAGLAVVGFAIFYVASPREGRSERASKPEKQAKAEPAEPPRKPIIKRPLIERPVEAEEQQKEEAPELTLDDARKAFDDYVAELDREVARLEKTGGTLTQEDWVKYRTRAADAIDGVLRKLDHRDPNMIIEIKAKQEAVKSRLDKIKPPGAN